jgi:acyl carrier protein
MTPVEIRALIKDELGGIAPEVDFDAIDPTRDLRTQTDLDSMDFLNLITAIHQRLGVDIPESDYPRLATLQGFIDYLAE